MRPTIRDAARWLPATLLLAGCRPAAQDAYQSVSEPPQVRIAKPTARTITRVVGQPSFVEAYERTSIYPKMTAYIEKWIVDIGDKVKKDDTLATLFVPELVEDYGTKKADVKLEEERIDLSMKAVEVADANVQAAKADVDESKAELGKYQAEVDRWTSEVERLDREVKRGVVDKQVLLESQRQLRSSAASRDAARAMISKSEADELAREADAAKARVDVEVARARLAVAQSEERRLKAWVGYLTLTAPFDGIIVVRNANTGDFVLPASGDPTALRRSPDVSTGGASPIYVVDRTDVVRIFVDIPEQDANSIDIGTRAEVYVKAYKDEEIPAKVTRTAWALNIKSRTLRAEIDLPNPGSKLLPGMYAYARVFIDRPGALAVPRGAIQPVGEKSYCFLESNGRAVRTQVEVGATDGEWVELARKRPAGADGKEGDWAPIDGSERIILADLTLINDGDKVKVVSDGEAQREAGGGPLPTGGK
ncbi:MAG: efflux RND transporter periplasmic adaptor subunit [Isosphaeraceae bacterium]